MKTHQTKSVRHRLGLRGVFLKSLFRFASHRWNLLIPIMAMTTNASIAYSQGITKSMPAVSGFTIPPIGELVVVAALLVLAINLLALHIFYVFCLPSLNLKEHQ